MGQIYQQDNDIQISDGALAYHDNLPNFEADYGSQITELEGGEYAREYVPGKQHALFDGNLKFMSNGDLNWTEGDDIIAALPTILAAREARLAAARTLEDARAEGKLVIDASAGRARSRYITTAPGQEMTYLEKSEQAADYVTAGYPADTSNYPFIQAEMNATGLSKEDAADGILAQKSAWIAIGVQIEEHRLGGKAAVDAATDLAGVDSAVAAAVALLDAV